MNVRLLIVGALIWTSALALGAEKEVEDLLAKMRSAYGNAKTARLIIKATNESIGKKPVTMDIYYMRPNKIRAKATGLPFMKGKDRTYTTDGNRSAVDDFTGTPQIGEFDVDGIPMPINLEVMSFWDWKRQLSTSHGANMEHSKFKIVDGEKWNSKSWTVLEETAYGQGVFVRYFVDPKTSFIHRVVTYDLSRTKIRFESVVEKLQINLRVDSKMFTIKTPKTIYREDGVEITIDGPDVPIRRVPGTRRLADPCVKVKG